MTVVLQQCRDRLSDQSCLRIHPETARTLGLIDKRQLVVSYGQRQEELLLYLDARLEKGCIQLGELSIQHLLCVIGPSYRLRVLNNCLIIGPVIGMMMRHTETQLLDDLKQSLPYLALYRQVGGLVFLFANDQIDFESQKITGFLWDSEKDNVDLERRSFPFPTVWYRRVGFKNTKSYRKTRQSMSQYMVNGYYFTKWEFWRWLEKNPHAAPHLAYSTTEVDKSSLDSLLQRFGSVYIKPKMGYGGQGIEKAWREGDHYVIQRNYEETLRISEGNIAEHLSSYRHHLLQQPIGIVHHEGRQVTYRAIVQRDDRAIWRLTGLVGFFGGVGEITGNWSRNGGFLKQGDEALTLQCKGDVLMAFRLKMEVERVCSKVANVIAQEIDGYVDFGMDIGIDVNGHVWIIEANKRQHYETCEHAKDYQLHFQSMANNLVACGALAMGYMKESSGPLEL